jgi:hypothetical protein
LGRGVEEYVVFEKETRRNKVLLQIADSIDFICYYIIVGCLSGIVLVAGAAAGHPTLGTLASVAIMVYFGYLQSPAVKYDGN